MDRIPKQYKVTLKLKEEEDMAYILSVLIALDAARYGRTP